MYFAGFATLDDERYYVSVDVKTGNVRLERVCCDAIARFIQHVLSLDADQQSDENEEVSA